MNKILNLNRPVILFDLDGTLLPMNNDQFEYTYFKGLSEVITDFAPQDLVKYIWTGTKAMMTNNGEKPNRDVFAETFISLTGMDYYSAEEVFTRFYKTKFLECKDACPITDISKKIVKTLQDKGYTVAIATNPIFPKVATYARLDWIGLNPEDFPLVTTFEDSYHAKPNPDYYREVCERLSVSPQDCIMIGNDVVEDGCAASLGMEVVLVGDCLLNKKNLPLDDLTVVSLQEVYDWAVSLPVVR